MLEGKEATFMEHIQQSDQYDNPVVKALKALDAGELHSNEWMHCRQENGSMCIPPMETSFSHWNMLLLSQDENPIIERIFAGNPNIQFFRCLPNRDVISSLNPPNSHDPNGGTYVRIGGLLKEKRLFSGRLPN